MSDRRELTGVFTVETKLVESTQNNRYIVKGADGKQVGSTFDEELGEKLLSFAPGVQLTVTVDKSGKFWNVIHVELAAVPAAPVVGAAPAPTPTPAPAPAATTAAPAPVVAAQPATPVPAPAATTATPPVEKDAETGEVIGAFTSGQFTYFMGYSARIVSALIASDPVYAAKLAVAGDPVTAASNDVLRGAQLLYNTANKIIS